MMAPSQETLSNIGCVDDYEREHIHEKRIEGDEVLTKLQTGPLVQKWPELPPHYNKSRTSHNNTNDDNNKKQKSVKWASNLSSIITPTSLPTIEPITVEHEENMSQNSSSSDSSSSSSSSCGNNNNNEIWYEGRDYVAFKQNCIDTIELARAYYMGLLLKEELYDIDCNYCELGLEDRIDKLDGKRRRKLAKESIQIVLNEQKKNIPKQCLPILIAKLYEDACAENLYDARCMGIATAKDVAKIHEKENRMLKQQQQQQQQQQLLSTKSIARKRRMLGLFNWSKRTDVQHH